MAFIIQIVAHHQVTAIKQIDNLPMSMGIGKRRFTSFVNAEQIRSVEATIIDETTMENFSTVMMMDGTEYCVEDVDMKWVWEQLAKRGMIAL